jgi:hypothetical protein
MLKNLVKLEKKVGERVYQMICDPDSPLGEIHDALHEMKDYVVKKMNEIHEAQKKPEDAKPEEEKKE